ncbi:MAG: hypothetical protein ACOCSQ_05465 [Planctomycetota bacterium]
MTLRRIVLHLTLLFTLTPVLLASSADDAETIFKDAFEDETSTEEQKTLLETVAKEHEKSRWLDDALWCLAEIADHEDRQGRALVLRRQILNGWKSPSLEEFTRKTSLYRNSRLRRIEFLLERTGYLYERQETDATRHNALPMVLREQMGEAYRDYGLFKAARREYEYALDEAPDEGYVADMYRKRMDGLPDTEESEDTRIAESTQGGGQEGDNTSRGPEPSNLEKFLMPEDRPSEQ